MDEDEVDEQVSSLKKQTSDVAQEEIAPGLGIHQGTFKWNEVEEVKAKKDAPEGTHANGDDDTSTVVDSASIAGSDTSERRFQLNDISVMFPEGELTVVTGPTASGKTALLVCVQDSIDICPNLTQLGTDGLTGRTDAA